MKNILKIAFVALFGATLVFSACKKDETNAFPVVTAPSTQEVGQGLEVVLSFSFTSEAGFKSSTVTEENGSAVVTTDGADGAGSGTIEVTFTAGTTNGAGSVTLSVTDKDDQTTSATAVLTVVEEQTLFNVSADITGDVTWETGNVYVLQDRIGVLDGATLTIEPGVIVKGQVGSDVNATALVVARGGTLNALGTADAPIIFTSIADNIMPGEIVSPNLLATDRGLWGGLIVLGYAECSLDGDVEEARIEGLPDTEVYAFYGGTDNADNSGTIQYISIRHGGTLLGEGNEINGLTLGGVGNGTTIENVEVVANVDDGIEWFGGSVDVTNAVIWNVGDDAVDTDQSWNGTLDNFVVVNPTNSCFELDGPEGSNRIGGNHLIQNGTVRVLDAGASLCDNDDNTNVDMNSVYFYDIVLDLNDDEELNDFPMYHTFPEWEDHVFLNLEIMLPTEDEDGNAVVTTVADFFEDGFESIAVGVTAPTNAGATLTAFDGWSWARTIGGF